MHQEDAARCEVVAFWVMCFIAPFGVLQLQHVILGALLQLMQDGNVAQRDVINLEAPLRYQETFAVLEHMFREEKISALYFFS